jgi:hypothetical protein
MDRNIRERFPLVKQINGEGLSAEQMREQTICYLNWKVLGIDEKESSALLQNSTVGDGEPEYIYLLGGAWRYWIDCRKW